MAAPWASLGSSRRLPCDPAWQHLCRQPVGGHDATESEAEGDGDEECDVSYGRGAPGVAGGFLGCRVRRRLAALGAASAMMLLLLALCWVAPAWLVDAGRARAHRRRDGEAAVLLEQGVHEDLEQQGDHRCAEFASGAAEGYLDDYGICPSGGGELRQQADVGVRGRDSERDRRLLKTIADHVGSLGDGGSDGKHVEEFREALQILRQLESINARDVLALQETWTKEDSEVLRRLDGSLDEDFASLLPSAGDLSQLVRDRPCAVVAATRPLRDSHLGEEIDGHEVVVRFDEDSHVDSKSVGEKTTIRVVRGSNTSSQEDGVLAEFDMEVLRPWKSYCRALRGRSGRLRAGRQVYMLRPTALCSLGNVAGFSRRFLFYWFVGRLYTHLDLYGFQRNSPEEMDRVGAANLEFENLVYQTAFRDQGDQLAVRRVERTTSDGGAIFAPLATTTTMGMFASLAEEATVEDFYEALGDGWCRPSGCDLNAPTCRVNGFFKDETDYDECMGACGALPSCLGFAVSSEVYSAQPRRCYVHTVSRADAEAQSGWTAYLRGHFDISEVSAVAGVSCYKVRDPPDPEPETEALVPEPVVTDAPTPPPPPPEAPAGARCELLVDPGQSEWAELRTPGVCPEGPPGAFVAADVGVRTRDPDRDDQLLADLRRYIDAEHEWTFDQRQSFEDAYSCLEKIVHVEARDVFALQETWTDDDTDILRRLDPGDGGFVKGTLTTEAFRQRLPTAEQFAEVVEQRTLAIVGAAGSLLEERPGALIDGHDAVVRFNDHVLDNLDEPVTGTKTTVHVTCDAAGGLEDSDVVEVDLETRTPWNSYCRKLKLDGAFYLPNTTWYIMRPTALCAMDENFALFTRGFLYYWFVGRMFDQLDMYGFDGDDHYDNDATVWEMFLPLEHVVYGLASGKLKVPKEGEDG